MTAWLASGSSGWEGFVAILRLANLVRNLVLGGWSGLLWVLGALAVFAGIAWAWDRWR